MDINKILLFEYHCKAKHYYSTPLLKSLNYENSGIFVYEQLMLISMKHNDLKTFKFLLSQMVCTEYPWPSRILCYIQACNVGYKMIEYFLKIFELNVHEMIQILSINNLTKQNKWLKNTL